MPREARQAMDGPSRRPPERRWSEGTPAKPGPDDGASPFGFFWGDCQKRLARGAKPETSPELGNQQGSILLATLNADRANEFAPTVMSHRCAMIGATQLFQSRIVNLKAFIIRL
ncbi:hypothetical protein thsps21_31190 [Pseudomonas sp. No.21]